MISETNIFTDLAKLLRATLDTKLNFTLFKKNFMVPFFFSRLESY